MNHKMKMMRKRLACCTRDRERSIDFDHQQKVMTYNGLESYILNSPDENPTTTTTHTQDRRLPDSRDDVSSCSSSNNVSSSFASQCTTKMGDDECESSSSSSSSSLSPQHNYVKEKPSHKPSHTTTEYEDLETMKERFSKLLLGEDITGGGSKGISTALALSNAISNLAASVFGELWKLEPLQQERKNRWIKEMDWFVSPTIYMVELVPAKQNGSNGHIVEIMMPKARSDIHMNLPALKKLDSMLIETLDSMMNNEFWYAEVGSRAEGRSKSSGQSRRWWLPTPRVPIAGLSETERQKLLHHGRLVSQVFKAAKSINDNVLFEMPLPDFIRDALPKSGKETLGEEFYKILTKETNTAGDTIKMLNLKSENNVLEAINKLEAAIYIWKEKIEEQVGVRSSPVRRSWSFLKDPITEMDRTEYLYNKAEMLLKELKFRYPNLPHTFLDAVKVQYSKDVGHSIIEAYSRVLGNLAFSIVTRIGDILQEDIISNPNSPIAVCSISGIITESPMLDRIRLSLIDKMNRVSLSRDNASDMKSQSNEHGLCSM